jgi:cyclophilin family peptidyl-prolyl cis-trans isomerase/protein-disulfide isomerase
MKKFIFTLLFMAAMLAACNPTGPVTPTPAPSTGAEPSTGTIPTQDVNATAMECSVVSVRPTPGPTEVSMFPPVDETDWVMGNNPDAALTVIEYSDFQCPYCAQIAPVLEELQKKYPDDVRLVFRHFPLPSHNLALLAAQATEAAGIQGKFWEMHNRLFEQQGAWAGMTNDQFVEWLGTQAGDLQLDAAKFSTDLQSDAVTKKVKDAQDHAVKIGLPGTPFILVNGGMFPDSLPRDLASFESILDLYRLEERQFTYCPPMQIDPAKQYIATLKTDKGDVKLELLADKAPMAVNSFVFLSRQGYFNNVTFHRVLENFVAQSGDPSGTGFGGPGYSFKNEISDLKFDQAGMVGMANSGPDTNGSQFFITFAPVPDLDGKYTIFAQVIEGMDTLQKLTPRNPAQTLNLPPGDKILSVEIQEK